MRFRSHESTTIVRRRWLSTGEAAQELGITPRTLYRLIDTGRLAAYRLGRVIRIESDDLHSYLQSTRISPGSLAHLYRARRREEAAVG